MPIQSLSFENKVRGAFIIAVLFAFLFSIYSFFHFKGKTQGENDLTSRSFLTVATTQRLEILAEKKFSALNSFYLTKKQTYLYNSKDYERKFHNTLLELKGRFLSEQERSLLTKIENAQNYKPLATAIGALSAYEVQKLEHDVREAKIESNSFNILLIVFALFVVTVGIYMGYFTNKTLLKHRELIGQNAEMKKQARDAEDQIAHAVRLVNLGFFDHDHVTHSIFCSNESRQILGLTPDEPFIFPKFLSIIHPEDKERVLAYIKAGHDPKGEGFGSSEYRVIHPNGAIRWIRSRSQTFFTGEGPARHSIRTIGALLDLTESKEIEQALLDAKVAAEKADQAKSQFLANMSHEIRTPMNAILGFSEILINETLSRESAHEYLQRIKVNGTQLLHLIDDILDLSKVEAGKTVIHKINFSIIEILQEVILLFESTLEKKGLNLDVKFLTAIPQVIFSDPVRLKQILTNILGNAIKFTSRGSIQIELSFSNRFGPNQKPTLIVDIKDTGLGIPQEEQAKLFQPFTQTDAAIARKYGGTGLGLALSKRLGVSIGGDLILKHSRVGEGSCFELSVDVGDIRDSLFISTPERFQKKSSFNEPVVTHSPEKSNLITAPRLTGKKILLAEDSLDNELIVRYFLKSEGAHIEVAHNGIEAIEKAMSTDFDIVLMDIQMPELDGLEATKQLRANGYTRPIIALTAHALKEEVERSLQYGCNAHMVKPFKHDLLVKEIQKQILA